jgi:hypothetical protein
MPVTLKGNLPLSPKLSSTAQSAFVLDDLQTGTLVSLAQLCDDDCIAIFNKHDVKILKNDKVIITDTRMSDGLWSLPIKPPHHKANGILRTDKRKQELATHLHAALGSPAPSTLLRAIRRHHLVTLLGLTANLVTKHSPKSLAAVLGYRDQEAKHLRSTKALLAADTLPVPEPDLEPALNTPSHHMFAMLFDKVQIMKSCSDQTGRFRIFPVAVITAFLSFVIMTPTLFTPQPFLIVRRLAFAKLGRRLINRASPRVMPPIFMFLTTNALKNSRIPLLNTTSLSKACRRKNIEPTLQKEPFGLSRIILFPPSVRLILISHCPNGIDFSPRPSCRSICWPLLACIHPCLLMLLSLVTAISIECHLLLLAPKLLVMQLQNAAGRTTFGEHGKVGWHIGPPPEHCRCCKCCFPDTMTKGDVLAVDFFPENISFPTFTADDCLKQTAKDMLHLCSPARSATFFSIIL